MISNMIVTKIFANVPFICIDFFFSQNFIIIDISPKFKFVAYIILHQSKEWKMFSCLVKL